MEMDLERRSHIEPVRAVMFSVILPETNCEIDKMLSEQRADED